VLRPDFERTEEEKEKKESTFLSNAPFSFLLVHV